NPDPKVAKWVTDFTSRAGGDSPSNTDVLMYDTIFLLKQCIDSGGVSNQEDSLAEDRTAIRDCVQNVKDFPGIVGPINFNQDGDAVLPPTVLEAHNSKW